MTQPDLSAPPFGPAHAFNLAAHPASANAVPTALFTGAMSTLAASVTLVTAAKGDDRQGRTVTSILSLSAEPPALLVSITATSALARTIRSAGRFAVAILAEGQNETADTFAGLGPQDRFSAGTWSAFPSGQPRLADAVANFDCVLAGTIEIDTHVLFAGIVMRAAADPERPPLLWHGRRYATLA